ncbi:hypothetical protein RF11_05610 [Thelohanellus kitauei]|uniref:EGF-like domain-containing protein n=1 Tax=Thelohanellus kitauei TaxID=669202 RepID=A0A0C2MFP9_THEKT|nr:hypothetical protein RF11_05610 [Thelohanellus kitauei]
MHKNLDNCIDASFGVNLSSANTTGCVCHEGYFGSHCNLTGKSLVDIGHDLIRLYSIKLTPEYPLMNLGYWVACSISGIILIAMICRIQKCVSLKSKFNLNYLSGPKVSDDESQTMIDE